MTQKTMVITVVAATTMISSFHGEPTGMEYIGPIWTICSYATKSTPGIQKLRKIIVALQILLVTIEMFALK